VAWHGPRPRPKHQHAVQGLRAQFSSATCAHHRRPQGGHTSTALGSEAHQDGHPRCRCASAHSLAQAADNGTSELSQRTVKGMGAVRPRGDSETFATRVGGLVRPDATACRYLYIIRTSSSCLVLCPDCRPRRRRRRRTRSMPGGVTRRRASTKARHERRDRDAASRRACAAAGLERRGSRWRQAARLWPSTQQRRIQASQQYVHTARLPRLDSLPRALPPIAPHGFDFCRGRPARAGKWGSLLL